MATGATGKEAVTAATTAEPNQTVSIDTPFPNGQKWSLYFHDTENKKWTLDTYKKITTVGTWRQFYEMIHAIDYDLWSRGMFFFMRDPIPPLWENAANIRGGNYSMRIGGHIMIDVFTKYAIACIIGEATAATNIIQGISMTPKKGFFVIKVWNKDSTKFNNPDELIVLDGTLKSGAIIYTPFVEKRM